MNLRYGSFPFYLQMLGGAAHGALLMNSNGMDVTYSSSSEVGTNGSGSGSDKITFKTIGGLMDLYVFTGPTPESVVAQYQSVIGRPALMPYWSLGFHNCRYGYSSLAQVEEVVANYSAAGIPLDTQWVDIDYMDAYRDFSTDPVDFATDDLRAFVEALHTGGQHLVPIVDPGIMVTAGYTAYEEGMAADVFIRDIKGGYYLGQVWPGPTYFPDFLHPNAQNYWTDQLREFYKQVPIDGVWIDMNEVSK